MKKKLFVFSSAFDFRGILCLKGTKDKQTAKGSTKSQARSQRGTKKRGTTEITLDK